MNKEKPEFIKQDNVLMPWDELIDERSLLLTEDPEQKKHETKERIELIDNQIKKISAADAQNIEILTELLENRKTNQEITENDNDGLKILRDLLDQIIQNQNTLKDKFLYKDNELTAYQRGIQDVINYIETKMMELQKNASSGVNKTGESRYVILKNILNKVYSFWNVTREDILADTKTFVAYRSAINDMIRIINEKVKEADSTK